MHDHQFAAIYDMLERILHVLGEVRDNNLDALSAISAAKAVQPQAQVDGLKEKTE